MLVSTGPTETEAERARRNVWEIEAAVDSPEKLAGFYAGEYPFDCTSS